jgi:endonuclease-3
MGNSMSNEAERKVLQALYLFYKEFGPGATPNMKGLDEEAGIMRHELDDAVSSALLRNAAPRKKKLGRPEPVDNLIRTILSQNTNDPLRDRAYASLKKQFPTHDAIAAAELGEIAMAIKVAGLSNQKSETIKGALVRIKKERGEISLDFLKDIPTEEAVSYLTGFNGIGDKTAAIVMLFSFGRKTFPVDTHIQRITKRTGLVPNTSSPAKIRTVVEPYISAHLAVRFHVSLIHLGKTACRPKEPSCHQEGGKSDSRNALAGLSHRPLHDPLRLSDRTGYSPRTCARDPEFRLHSLQSLLFYLAENMLCKITDSWIRKHRPGKTIRIHVEPCVLL